MKSQIIILIVLLSAAAVYISGCGNNFPMDKDISKITYRLVDHDSTTVIFPHKYQGKTVVMGFIFTNCPDICPMTTHNMQLIQQKAKEADIENVQFVALSFDPERDTPEVLKEYARVRDIDLSNFDFITGERATVDSLLRKMGVLAISGDTTYTDNGEPIYFYTHTDRITLIDGSEHIRKEYKGSRVNVDEVIKDLKELGD